MPATDVAPFVQRGTFHVFEVNEIIHSIPASITSGRGLFSYFWNRTAAKLFKGTSALVDTPIRYVVFVADNYLKVPAEKSAVHTSRQSSHAPHHILTLAELRSIHVTDDTIPPPELLRANPVLFYKAIHYLFARLAAMDPIAGTSIYISYPSIKTPPGTPTPTDIGVDAPFEYGKNYRLTTTGPDPPTEWPLGEGEILAHLWAHWFVSYMPLGATRFITSVDNDNIPFILLAPIAHSVNLFVRLRDRVVDGVPTARFFNADALRSHFTDQALAASLAFVAILCGSDYCVKIPRVGPQALLKAAFTTSSTKIASHHLFIRASAALTPNTDAIKKFASSLTKKPIDTSLSISTAIWNCHYWASSLPHG
jgi:hypothetical protein